MIRVFVRRRPIAAFLGLTLLYSWLVWTGIIFILPPGGLLKTPTPTAILLVIVGGMGPSLIGIGLTAIADGQAGLRALWARLGNWRVHPAWYVVPLIPFGLNLIGFLVLGWLRPDAPPEDVFGRVAAGLGVGLFAGLSEEFGWRGFALPRLQQRHSALASALMVGLGWGVWHIYADFIGLGWLAGLFIPVVLLVGPLLLTAYAVMMTWVHNQTGGSLLLMVLFHIGISSSAIILGRTNDSPAEELQSALILPLLASLLAAIIVVIFGAQRLVRGHRSRSRLQPMEA